MHSQHHFENHFTCDSVRAGGPVSVLLRCVFVPARMSECEQPVKRRHNSVNRTHGRQALPSQKFAMNDPSLLQIVIAKHLKYQ